MWREPETSMGRRAIGMIPHCFRVGNCGLAKLNLGFSLIFNPAPQHGNHELRRNKRQPNHKFWLGSFCIGMEIVEHDTVLPMEANSQIIVMLV